MAKKQNFDITFPTSRNITETNKEVEAAKMAKEQESVNKTEVVESESVKAAEAEVKAPAATEHTITENAAEPLNIATSINPEIITYDGKGQQVSVFISPDIFDKMADFKTQYYKTTRVRIKYADIISQAIYEFTEKYQTK